MHMIDDHHGLNAWRANLLVRAVDGILGTHRILELIGEGLTNRQIGERMFLAEKTVKNYVSALFAKLGMERRTQAAAYAVRVFGDQHDVGGESHHGPGD